MPTRNQSMIRRDINRLKETIQRYQDKQPALAAIADVVSAAAASVNSAWQEFQARAVAGDKEREERDSIIDTLTKWIQRWRHVLLMLVPGADMNVRQLPSSGATPDDVIRVAQDMAEFIKTNPAAESFRDTALASLGDLIARASKETAEATVALPAEAAARQAYTEACNSANTVLVRGTEVVRSIFGRTSPEYKQFIARASSEEEEEIAQDAFVGEA